MQLQNCKVITLVTDIPTASSDVDFHLEPKQIVRGELEEKKIYIYIYIYIYVYY